MKKTSIRLWCLLGALLVMGRAGAQTFDAGSSEFIEYLLALQKPSAPAIFENAVVFTAPSLYKRVGVAFANEHFSKIHWFAKLLVPIDDTVEFVPKSKIIPDYVRDSGILFYAYTPPAGLDALEYRLIIDGLWSADPLNKAKRADPVTGLELSVTQLPPALSMRQTASSSADARGLVLAYQGKPGEFITVAGDFNNWDPFMYQMREVSAGEYRISIPLPAGEWHYVLFKRGERILDPQNLNRVYSPNGMAANAVVLK